MNRTDASAKLQTRRRRTARRRGPASQQFTAIECEAIRVLSSHGKTQESLARDSGMTIKQFRTAMEKDEKLRDAGPQTQRQGATDVIVNINANTIPPAQDGRTYAALMKRIQKGNVPTFIEHDEPERPMIVDPIASVKAKQRQERGEC